MMTEGEILHTRNLETEVENLRASLTAAEQTIHEQNIVLAADFVAAEEKSTAALAAARVEAKHLRVRADEFAASRHWHAVQAATFQAQIQYLSDRLLDAYGESKR